MGGVIMCKTKCPQCGFEFEAQKPSPIVNVQWTEHEDKLLLYKYQSERKTIPQIAEELNRTQDAVRNHLFKLRGAGKQTNSVTISVSMTAGEYDRLRADVEGKLASVQG